MGGGVSERGVWGMGADGIERFVGLAGVGYGYDSLLCEGSCLSVLTLLLW